MRLPFISKNLQLALLIGAVAALGNALFWVHGSLGGFSNLVLHEADQMVYSCLARDLANGQGFVDSCIYPISLSVIEKFPHPYLRGTLFPMMLVPFFVLFGARDVWAIVPVWLCYGLLVGFTFLLARRVLTLKGSLVACALVALNPVIVRLSVRSLPDLPGALAVVILLLVLDMKAKPFILGLVFAATCCLRPTFAFLLPLVLWGAGDGMRCKDRLTAAFQVGIGAMLLVWPWMLRNYLITRNPFYSFLGYDLLSHTPSFRDIYVWNLMDAPDPVTFALSHPVEMVRKVFQVIVFTATICRPEAVWILLFGIPAALFFLPGSAFRNRALAATLLIILPLLITHTEPRYFAPVIVPLVVLHLGVLEHKLQHRKGAWPLALFWSASLLVAFMVLNVMGLSALDKHNYSRTWLRWDQVDFFQKRTTQEHLIASDVPFAVSWECDRSTAFLPFYEKDLRAVDRIKTVDFIFVHQPKVNFSLDEYLKSSWFASNYQLLRVYDDETGSRMYRRKTSTLGGFGVSQLCQVREELFVLLDGVLYSVDADSLSRRPVESVPEGAVRIRGDEFSDGFHLLMDSGSIVGLSGASGYTPQPPIDGVALDFAFTPDSKGIFYLTEDGRVISRGTAIDLGIHATVIEQPLRLEVSITGRGVWVLAADGVVSAFGDSTEGREIYFGEPLAKDIALTPGTQDYYILDAFGSTHPSGLDQPLVVGLYRNDREWAVDLEILPSGVPYVLTDEGEILRFETKQPNNSEEANETDSQEE